MTLTSDLLTPLVVWVHVTSTAFSSILGFYTFFFLSRVRNRHGTDKLTERWM